MKKLFSFFKEFISCCRFFRDNKHIQLSQRIRVGRCHYRLSQTSKSIDLHDLYQIVGHVNRTYPKSPAGYGWHPTTDPVFFKDCDKSSNYPSVESYIRKVEANARSFGLEKHIIIDRVDRVDLSEFKGSYCDEIEFKVTVKNLIIYTLNVPDEMFFYPILSLDNYAEAIESGIYIVFENNHFVPRHGLDQTRINFLSYEMTCLGFKNNHFDSINMFLETHGLIKIELVDNIFQESDLRISCYDDRRVAYPSAVCIKGNLFFKDEGKSRFHFSGENLYLMGGNTFDSLSLTTKSLYWDGYQNIDPCGKNGKNHKEMFMHLVREAEENKDRLKESLLRRELLKSDAAVILKDTTFRTLQDRFILRWMQWVSNYGVSWIRPLCWLAVINALWATIIYAIPSQCPAWWELFFELFNPLSNISKMDGIKSNAFISLLKILQKALLAAFYYDAIRTLRRFSK